MKFLILALTLLLTATSFMPHNNPEKDPCYDQDFVEISNVSYKNEKFTVVMMKRDGDRIKAKYFAARDNNGNSVYNRYQEWKKRHGNIVLVSSGTYMDNDYKPQGLTIDNGIPVNESIIYNRMDAMAIVYATGGIVVTDLTAGDLSVTGGGISSGRKLNLRKSATDLEDFIEWSKSQEATVFQTHLLVYKNQLRVDPHTSSPTKRERRYLAVGKDEDDKIVHLLIHSPGNSSLYEGANKTLAFLNDYKDINVIFMINLDTGYQDVFELYNSNCTVNSTIKGTQPLNKAVNLLAYYFQ